MPIYFLGTADAVKQVSQVSITGYDGASTYGIVINGKTVSVAADTDANTTAANLVAALNAATADIYHQQITWTNPSAPSADIVGTADVAGVPFTFTTSIVGGAGTFGSVSTTTANSGPNSWDVADNWSGGAIPVSTDDVVIADTDVDILWGIDQNAVTLASLKIKRSFSGRIGLRRTAFATDADGDTFSTPARPEYREDFLRIGFDACDIGEFLGAVDDATVGSDRIKLDNTKSGASTLTVHDVNPTTADSGLPVVRYKANHADADVFVRSAAGGVGIGVDEPGESTTVGDVKVSDVTQTSKVSIGDNVTITSFDQNGGENIINLGSGKTLTTLDVDGGTCQIEGAGVVTTLNLTGSGTVIANNAPSSGAAIVTVNLDGEGATLDADQSKAARTYTTLNATRGTVVLADEITLTNEINPATGRRTFQIAET